MAHDIFLKINGIEGESQDANHKNEIEVLRWGWSVQQHSTMHSGSGGGSGRASVSDIRFEHMLDRASPNLLKYSLTGKHIDQAVLTLRKAGGGSKPLEYLKITMNDVIITNVSQSGGGHDVHESVSLSFAKVKQEYVVQNQQGGSGGVVTTGFDIKANKEI